MARLLSLACVLGALAAAPPAQTRPDLTVTVVARSLQPGELAVLTVTTREPATTLSARAFGRELGAWSVSPTSWRVLVGLDLGLAAGTHTVSLGALLPSREARATHRLAVKAKSFPRRTLKVDPAFVNPPASAVPRVQAEAKLLEDLWTSSSPDRLWTAAFVSPVSEPANSAFGSRSVFNGELRNPHTGADFPSPAGTPIRAPNAGRVRIAQDLYFSGQTIVIDHGLGVFSTLAHLSAMDVQAGDVVSAGAVMGRVGATGRVTGPHLHWAVRAGGARIDPMSLLAVLGSVK